MFKQKVIIILFFLLLYQSPIFSKSNSFEDFNSKTLSKYFSGIVAFENKNNSEALDFFSSSKILMNKHNPYLERFVTSLVLEGNLSQAINLIKTNNEKNNSNFFEAYILLALDSLKKNKIDKARKILKDVPETLKKDRFKFIIHNSLEQFIIVFQSKKLKEKTQDFGNLSLITETFQRCYLDDKKTGSYFSRLINNAQSDYSRYIYFYLTYLIEKDQFKEAKEITDDLDYISTTLLLSQGKSWIEKKTYDEFEKVFSCKNPNDILAEFLFLVSNLYSSQNEFEKSNYYLSLSNYLNPEFIFNLSLVAENFYLNKNYKEAKSILKNFNKKQDF